MNKKAFLLGEETLKIIIAVICIVFLVYLLVSLYFSHKNSKDFENAEASLEYLTEIMNSEIGEAEIYNPKGKLLISWPYRLPGKSIIPASCSNLGWNNCICICEGVWGAETEEDKTGFENFFNSIKGGLNSLGKSLGIVDDEMTRLAEKCSSKWVCKEVSSEVIIGDGTNQIPIVIENPPLRLEILYKDKIIIKRVKDGS